MLWTDLTFGVEIECYFSAGRAAMYDVLRGAGVPVSVTGSYTHARTDGWKVVTDGSLDAGGLECVSPVLRGVAGLEQVARVANAIKAAGGYTNTTCGLHVHIGAASASVEQMKNLAKLFVQYEQHLDAVCPADRRGNYYARSNRETASSFATARFNGRHPTVQQQIDVACAAIDAAQSISRVANVMNGQTNARYHKMNFQSLTVHGTVEYRQQAGTIDATVMTNWIKTVAQFTAGAWSVRAVAAKQEPTFARMLRKFENSVASFLSSRQEQLAA